MAVGDWLKIGGQVWNVRVLSITEEATILYSENTGRTMAANAPMVLDPLGTFIGHKIEVAPMKNYESDFDRLYDFVNIPRKEGLMVECVHYQDTISYRAYISQASRAVKRINENSTHWDNNGVRIKVKWDKMSLNIVPMSAQISP